MATAGDRAPAVLVAVHAHPDDESLATGLALAHHAARGDRMHVITCTLGEEGEVIPPGLAHLEGSQELGPYRAGELARAVAELGVQQEYLGGRLPRWRDSGMAGTPSADHPRAFLGADVAEAAELLAGRLADLAPDAVLTYDDQGGYGHPDHIQAHRVTLAAVRAMPPATRPVVFAVVTPRTWAVEDRAWLRDHVPSGGPTVPAPGEPYPASVVDDGLVTHAVVDPAALPAQVAALEQHATQVTVYDGYYALSNEIAARLPGREGYAVLDPASGRLHSQGDRA